jgi:membrane dipeptidase
MGKFLSFLIVLSFVFTGACRNNSLDDTASGFQETARKICEKHLILDSHIDWPERLYSSPADLSQLTESRDFDLVRAKTGGLNAVLSVLYIPAELGPGEGRIMLDSMQDLVTGYAVRFPDRVALARSPDEVAANFARGLLSIPLCLENGSPIGDDLSYIEALQRKGMAYITLCHAKSNQICDSNYDSIRPWKGVSPFGEEVIREMNRQGIMIDISHSTDSTVFQALRISEAPIVASHSSCRYFTPGFERNLSDTLIKAIAEKNGVVMIGFGSMFLDSTCSANTDSLLSWFDATGVAWDSKEGAEFIQTFSATHRLRADAAQVVDHIDHVVRMAGIDYVGFGSDFDGIGPSQPVGLPDVSSYPMLVAEMLRRGYSEEEVEKVLSKNFLRVWQEVLNVSRGLKEAPAG